MAKTYNQIKESVLGKDYDINRNIGEQQKTYSEIKSGVMNGKYNFARIKSNLEKTINFDTFESDLTSINNTIVDTYNGWQTPETMKNTLSSIESMQERVRAFKEYTRLFGNKDTVKDTVKGASDILSGYNEVLGGWDELSNVYKNYENADSFNASKKFALMDEKYAGLTFDEVQAEKRKYDKNSFEYKYFDNYTKYTDLREFDKAIDAKKNGYKTDIRYTLDLSDTNSNQMEKNLKEFKLYPTDDAQNTTPNKVNAKFELHGDLVYPSDSNYYEDLIFKSRDLETERNKWNLDHSVDSYKDAMQNEDFEKNSKYVSTKGDYDNWWEKINKGQYGIGYGDLTYEYINNAEEGIRDEISSQISTYSRDTINLGSLVTRKINEKNYEKMNPDEVSIYNYLYYQDKKNGTDKAQKFLDDIQMNLDAREYNEQTKRWEIAYDNPIVATIGGIASVPASVFGGIPATIDTAINAIQGNQYNPYSQGKAFLNFAQDTREYVGENIAEATPNIELFGQNIPSFLYQTGMSLADNLVGAPTLKGAYLPLMGTNAFHQKAKELTEAGEDSETIYATALASGAAEMVFEKFSLDRFLKIKDVDSVGKIVTNALKQAGVEASEELATEFSNILTDNIIRGDSSELNTKYQELLQRGFTAKEANTEIAKQIGSQLGWAMVGGGLSGGAMGVVGATGNYIENRSQGGNIKSNERVADLFDIVSTPEISSAYEAYTNYANKGINADNISDAQLGNLYNHARSEMVDVLKSKKTTAEQKQGAMKTLARLSVVDTENTVAKEARKEFNVGEATKVTESGVAVDVKDLSVKGNEVVLATEKGEISVDDMTLTQKDAELVLLARGIANSEGEDIANLFLSQYDGKTDAEEYATSFNLTMAYAKNDFTYDTILNNKRALTTDQVNAIYQETRIKSDKDKQKAINKLNKEMADKMAYTGYIDDSAITEEVWNQLDSRQKQAVTFIKGFAQATGMNLVLTHNPDSKHGGSYAVKNNTITIDIAKYNDYAGVLRETIIPTMSHETTHWMKEKSPELWRELNEIVFSTLLEHYNSNTEQAIKDKRILYRKMGRNYSDEVLKDMTITEELLIQAEMNSKGKSEDVSREEIIARACEDMLSMSKEGRKYFDSLSETEKKTFVDKIKEIIEGLKDWVSKLLGQYKSDSYEAKALRNYQDRLNEILEIWDKMLVESVKANQSLEKSGEFGREVKAVSESKTVNEVKAVSDEKVDTESGFYAISDLMDVLSEAVNEDGEQLFQYRAMVEDEKIYREMLLEHRETIGITPKQIEELFTLIDKAVGIIKNNLEALDYAWKSDIDDRAFSPVKQNSDSLYKVSLDFSTLCRKRLLQQIIQATLQEALNKPLSKEEGIAIRDELMKLQEEGRQIEVACALCYVESARMKSPEQIKRFLDNREAVIKDFFAGRSGGSIKEKVKNAETKAREELKKKYPKVMPGKNGAKLDAMTAKLKQMLKDDAEYIRSKKKEARASYKLTEQEQAELETAMKLSVSDFTSAKGLENLAKNHSDIFDAYTSYIRNATHSKGLENDVWWRAGDSDSIGDNLIRQMNEENGLRSQSWSDFQVIHLLDYIAATIELSTKGAKRQSYTKVPDYVKLLGNTGDMINMSVIPSREFSGKLEYDDVEGMAYKVAVELRKEYHKTAGIICIGMDDAQIRLLLEDVNIDMVIPYHSSSMSKDTRQLMHIPAWKDYQSYQGEKKLKDEDPKAQAKKYGVKLKMDDNYGKAPKFSEWFDLTEARQIAKMENAHPSDEKAYKKYGKMYGGYMAMQNAANTYLKLCAERGIAPKFSHKNADYTNEANYWKLLIDRKMVDNVTGEIIEQKPIKPIFDEQSVLEILDDELERYPQVKADQEYAERVVVQKFLSGEMQVDKTTLEAIQKPVDNITEVNILESSRDLAGDEVLNADRNLEEASVYDLMGEKERLLKENEKFKAEVERLNERLKIEKMVTNGNYFNENQLGTVAGHLRNISNSLIDKVTLMKSLKDVYSFISNSPNLTWEEVFERCYNIADAMLAESKPEKVIDDYYKQILADIRSKKISLSESQKKEAQYIFGKNWNRNFFNRVTITDKGVPIDSQWQEWAELYPHLFDANISDSDMIIELYDILNTLRDASETVVEYDAVEKTRWLAREIYNQYWNVSPIRTTADKYDKRIRQLNFEHRRLMTEFREEYNSRLEAQKLADDIHYAGKLGEQKTKYEGKLAESKAQIEKQKELYKNLRDRKDKQIAEAKEKGREKLANYKENAERKTRIQRITANALSLNEMLVKNSKDKHIPEIMKGPVKSLLEAIDFSSKRLIEKGEPTQKDISLSKALSKVKDMMVKASNAHEELVELYGHGLDEDIEKMVDSVDDIRQTVGDNEYVLNMMSLNDLQTLDKMVKTIKYAVNKLNKFHTVNHAKGIANLSQESVQYLDSLGKGKIYDGTRGIVKKLLDWGNALPYYVFKRFGNGGMKVYEALQDGWDKFAFTVKKIIDYANETYTSKEVKEWSEEIKTFEILIPATEIDLANPDYKPQYQKVQLTVPQIMSMYCLNKREQARGHLFQGGIRVADFKDKKGNIVSQSDGVIFTEKDVKVILSSLTDRQKEVADKLQVFMNTVCSDWGNDVSMARFGYKAFGEENYFPIQSDKNNLAVNDETEQQNSLFKLLNMSFTKSTIENANNRIVISDIFDVFSQHTSDMAKYNALALPVLDSFKWYNYTEKQPIAEGTFKTSGVKQSIETAFGKDGQNYFTTFLKDINGSQESDREQLSKSFMRNYKIATVGANLRVVALQPTSYVRASAVIDNKYLTKALGHKPKIKMAETHCGIALWKSMGYFDTNIQRGVSEQIKHVETFKDKATNLSMKGAEIADKVTWGYLWNACELEVRDKRKDLKVGSEEFYTEIGKRLREVIYATQVVDSTMTRSQIMRSTKMHDQTMTNFASEPTLAYNMLQDAYMGYKLDARSMGKDKAIQKNAKRIARIFMAYTMTNAVAALIESGFDAFRDDDEEEMDLIAFMKLYLSNFASDMSITGKIPFIKEIHSVIKGYGLSRSELAWVESSYKAITGFYKNLQGKGNPSTTIKNILETISYLSSLPFYNVYRDTMATLNKLDLFTEEELNEMFKEFSLYGILE